jgi:hypothetical protein
MDMLYIKHCHTVLLLENPKTKLLIILVDEEIPLSILGMGHVESLVVFWYLFFHLSDVSE